MRKRLLTVTLLICALALSGCVASGPHAKPAVWPTVPPLPASLAQPINAEQNLRSLLFESASLATQKNER